jgi:hypothetical protein
MVLQEEDTMFEPNPCSVYLAGEIAHLYAILKSDGWKAVFAVFGATRAIVYFCGKSPHHEARDLAAAAVMASIFAVLIAVTESRAPTSVRHALACKAPDPQTRLSATEVPPAGPQLAFSSGR